jgi:hypothetical protein
MEAFTTLVLECGKMERAAAESSPESSVVSDDDGGGVGVSSGVLSVVLIGSILSSN